MSQAKKLLIIDDDEPFRRRLALSMERKGFDVSTAGTVPEAFDVMHDVMPQYVTLDLKLKDGSGLEIVEKLRDIKQDTKIIMLTAYGNIATAVAAVKAGATDYLAKPVDADAIEKALLNDHDSQLPPPPQNPMPADRVRWEHIQRIYEQCDRNVSETARRLQMHRRTLQRILAKYAPRESETDQDAL